MDVSDIFMNWMLVSILNNRCPQRIVKLYAVSEIVLKALYFNPVQWMLAVYMSYRIEL